MIIESTKVAEKISWLIADKRSAALKKITDVYTTSLKFRQGIEFSMKVFNVEKSLIFAFVNGGFYGFIANSEDEVLERLSRIKARTTPPERVLAKSMAIRVKRINDEILAINKSNADYRKFGAAVTVTSDLATIQLGQSMDEFRHNLLRWLATVNSGYRWSSDLKDIKRLIEVDQIGDEGFQRAFDLLITNEVLTE